MLKQNHRLSEFKGIKAYVLDSLLLYMTLGSLPLLATSLLNFYSSGWKISMIIDVLGLLSIPVVYFLRHRISYNVKTTFLISLGYISGLLIFLDYSILGSGMIILCAITLISTLFFGKIVGWLTILINIFSISLIGILYHYNILSYDFNFNTYVHSPLTWLDQIISFLFFIGAVVVASGQIHVALQNRIRQTTLEKEKFQKIFNNIQDAILIFSLDGKILEMNNSLLEMYGIERNSVFISKASEFGIIFEKEIFENKNDSENQRWQYESKAKRFDSHQDFYIEVMLSPIDYDDQKAILANIRNITQRRIAEEALRESEEKYRSLIESSPAGIFIIRSDKIIYTNPAGVKVLGYNSFEEISGKNIYTILDPEFRRIAEHRLELATRKVINAPIELRLYKADGSELWAETVSLPFEFYGSRAVLIMGFDITKRKKVEELLLQKNKEIENSNHEYAVLNQKLKAAKEKAEESDRLKSAFLSNMSHEIRTPMNAILGFSELLIKATLTEKKKTEYIEIINSSGNQLLSLINDIIDISKIESNQIVIDNSSQVNLNDVFKHLSVIFSGKAKSKNILLDYSVELDTSQALVFIDEIRLKQILVNLIGNALKFTHAGYVRYSVSLEKKELLFSVEDSGIGIEPQLQTIIFERFRQADGSTTRDYGGTGLGLAISKALVELMGGKIGLSSMPGKGTAFFFTLPYTPNESYAVPLDEYADPGEIEEKMWAGKTILLVEDEEVNILFLEELFYPTGINLLVARNAAQAYERVKMSTKIDLILMDIKIPEVNGYQIARVIRKKLPDIPVIAQTAYALAEERKKIMESGFDDYISKPISKTTLFNILSKFLDK